MSTFQSWNDVSDFIKGLLIPGKTGNTNVERLRSAFLAITAQMAAGGVDPAVDALWNEETVYPKDTQPVLWRDRWLVSNITNNEGIEPVTADGVVNPTWRLIGSSSGAGIRPWTAIVYPNILEMVFVDGALYYLDRDVVGVDPYLSADFAAELSAGDWKVMVGGGGSSGPGAGEGLTLEGGNLKLGDGNSIDFVPRTGTNNDAVLYLRGELSGISTSTVDGAYTTYYVREGESQILNVGDTTNTLLFSFARDLEAQTYLDQEAYPAGGGSRYTSVHEVVRNLDSFVEIIGRANLGSGNKLHKLQMGYVNGAWKASFEDTTDSPKGLEYAGDYSATLGANSLITKAIAEALVNALKGAVPTEGDTLKKLYDLITASFSEQSFATIAARDAYEVLSLPFQAFVQDDGDGKWAIYRATAIGQPGTYTKIMDQDLFNAVMSGSEIATAYEAYADVERFTTALKNKLDGLPLSITGNVDPAGDTLEKLYNLLTSGYVTLNTAQEIAGGTKKFGHLGFRLMADGGLGRKEVLFRSVSNSGAETVQNVPVFYINSNYDLAMTKGSLDGSGWKFVMNPTAFRAWTWKDEDGTVAFMADIAPAKIVEYLTSITEEVEKLPPSAIQGTPINGAQLAIDLETGALYILTDQVPTQDSPRFITSGQIKAYEDANPRGGSLSPGNNTTLALAPDTKNVAIRRIRGRNGAFYASSSDGGNNRFYSSLDGKFFMEGGTTGSLMYYAMDVAPHGTIIIAGRDGGPSNVKRSTDGGATFTNATITPTLEITGVVHIGAGKWALCARTADGSGNVAAYSHDDGLNWTMATGGDNEAMQDIAAGEGLVFMVSSLGTNKFQISTDFGVTYTALPVNPNSFFTQCLFFNGYIVLMRAGTTSTGATYLAISDDAGTTWDGRLVPDDDNQELQGISVIGEWLYLYGNNGYIARTKDLTTKEVIPAVTSNTIVSMSWSMINGKAVIMAACSNGTNNRILTTA